MLTSSSIRKPVVMFFVVALFLLPLVMKDAYMLHIIIEAFIWSILALGIRIVLLSGHLNAAQASFMGIGAYTSGLLALKLGWSFWLCLPAAGIMSALFAIGIGYPTLKIKGPYFVIVTCGVTEVFRHIWMMWDGLFGGVKGLLGIPPPDPITIGSISIIFNSKIPFYYLALILFFVTLFIMRRFDLSRMGLILKSMPQADVLAECVGVNLMKYKVISFMVGAFFAGLAGSFWAHYLNYSSPYDFTLHASFAMLTYAVIGGMASIIGPIVGTGFILMLNEMLWSLKSFTPIIDGAILVIILVYAPDGIISVPSKIRDMFKKIGG